MFSAPPRVFRSPESRLIRYAVATALIGTAVLLRVAIDPLVGPVAPFGLFVPAVVLAAWCAGVDGGILATALAALAGKFLFIEPRYQLAFTPRQLALMLMAVVVGCGLVLLVTTWRRAQLRLQDLHDEMAGILRQMPTGIVVADRGGHVVFVNAEIEGLLGQPAKLGTFAEFRRQYTPLHADGSPVGLSESPLLRAANGEDVPEEEAEIVRNDGARRIVRVRGTPVRRHDGTVVGGAVTVVDVTELRETARVARERAEEMSALLDAVPVAVFVARAPDGTLIDGNHVAARLFRAPPHSNFSLKPPEEGWRPAFRLLKDGHEVPVEDLPLQQAIAREAEVQGAELELVHPDGTAVDLLGNAVPLRDAHGTVRGAVAAFMDVTDRKRMEGELREQARELERVNRVKDEFLATLGHELRTPLAAIVGWAGMLLGGGLSSDVVRRAHEAIARNAELQRALIEDVLDVSRIVAGNLRLEKGPADVMGPLRAAVDAVKPQADEKGITITTTFSDAGSSVWGDTARLQQVFVNLLSNAVKFSANGGRVWASVLRPGDKVEVRVGDDGVGIAADHLPHIFERFRQADSSTTRRHTGLGLGLAIVRHLVELHDGTVEAESAGEGHGATFTVRLPYHDLRERRHLRADEPGRGVPAVPPVSPGAPSLHGRRVLVVDDEADTRELTTTVLAASGAKVTTAASAREALERLRAEMPDALLVDISMPEMDGYALIQAIRRSGNAAERVPAIAFTAHAGEEDRQFALMNGFQMHIAKPIDPGGLVRAVASVLEH